MFGKLGELTTLATCEGPDLILISETWCNAEICDAALSIPGYSLETDLRKDRQDTRNGIGGGLLVYSKRGAKLESCPKYESSNFNQFCALSILTNDSPLNIILLYRPPSSGADNMKELCSLLRQLNNNTLVIGDFNMPGVNWEELMGERKLDEFLETMEAEGLEQLVNFSTHNKGNILDLVVSKECNVTSVSEFGRLGNSDHSLIQVLVNIGGREKVKEERRPDWRKADFDNMRWALGCIDWRGEFYNKNLDEMWDSFKDIIHNICNTSVPVSTPRDPDKPPWLTRELIRLVRRKNRAWRSAKLYSCEETWRNYGELAKETRKKITNAKRNMERRLANSEDKGGTKFSRYIKSKSKTKTTIGPLKNSDGNLSNSLGDMTEILNTYFASVFQEEDLTSVPEKERETEVTLSLIEISVQKVRDKINKIKYHSAAGPDGITSMFLKETKNQIASPLSMIFAKSLEDGRVPCDWKKANVTPIFKKGAKSEPKNYRPVSLTSIPCKLLERIIKDELTKHLEENNLINKSQHGFTKGKSCATNLVEFLEAATKLVDEGLAADVFYLDFSKAFDMVPRERLLLKLEAKGISGKLLEWIRDWLSGRTQCVVLGSTKSSSCEVKSGVPQGTVLGPVLFSVQIDDIDIYTAGLLDLLVKFADDTKGLKKIADESDRRQLQEALNNLVRWAKDWGMSYNVEKCKIMHLGRANPQYEYTMGGVPLTVVVEEKDIGVVVHNSLKPARQCKKAADTAGAVLKTISKNFHYRDKKVFLKLYKTYVRPHLEFSTQAWSPWLEADKKMLENIQERAVKMISGLQGTSYEEKCREVGLESLESRRKTQDLVMTFREVAKGGGPRGGALELIGKEGNRTTRFSADEKNIIPRRSRLDLRKNFFTNRAADSWNSLDKETKRAPTVNSFKNRLKTLRNGGRPS